MAFTFFFRDEQTLKVLLEHALPVMQGQAFIRIWDAGCAHGPEPYTLAILLRERMSEMLYRNVRIHATDMERQFEAQVVSGIFPEDELRRRSRRAIRAVLPAGRPGLVLRTDSKSWTRCGPASSSPGTTCFRWSPCDRTCR